MKKVVKTLIIIIVPTVCAFLIGLYGYNHYQGGTKIKYDYYKQAEDNTKSELEYYLKYNEDKYEKDPVYKKDILIGEKKLLTFEIYRSSYFAINEENSKETEYARYIFVGYDVDYTEIKGLFNFGGSITAEKDASDPTLKLVLTNKEDDEEKFEIQLTNKSKSYDGIFNIVDYNATPKKDSPDPYNLSSQIGAIYTRWNIEQSYEQDFGTNFTMTMEATSTLYDDTLTLEEPLQTIDYRFDKKVSQFTDYEPVEGYNNDEFRAGYFGWVVKTYLWWICLLCFVVVGFLTYSFVLIWEAEDKNSNQRNKK